MSYKQNLIKKLRILTDFPSCSGNESGIIAWLKKELTPYAEKIFVDEAGNLVAIKGKPQLTLFAHVDKVGYMVSEVEKEKIIVVPLSKGKALPQKSHWRVVLLGKQAIRGVLIMSDKKLSELTTKVKKENLKHISIGDFLCIEPNFKLNKNSLVKSQGLDNKLGVLAACEVFKNCKNICFVATVQEEVTKIGAKHATLKLKPKLAIILDVTFDEGKNIKIGNGPTICLKDNLLPDKKIVNDLISIGLQNKLPYQLEVLESGNSDAGAVYGTNGYTPFVFLGIPIKHMHTPQEIGNITDLENTINLLINYFQKHG